MRRSWLLANKILHQSRCSGICDWKPFSRAAFELSSSTHMAQGTLAYNFRAVYTGLRICENSGVCGRHEGRLGVSETFHFDVFLSYHWRDHAPVESLAQRLRGAGLRVFLDRWYLVPGTNWLSALEKTLARCKSVAVCIGPEMGPGSNASSTAPWSASWPTGAEERSSRSSPDSLPGAESPLGFLKQNTWVDFRTGPDDPIRFAVLTKAIRGQPPGPDAQSTVQQALSEVCPYRGLLYFREQDAEFFCGRKVATIQLVEAIVSHPLVATVGASGSGKSSVVRAGLIPRLRGANPHLGDRGHSSPPTARCTRSPPRCCRCSNPK